MVNWFNRKASTTVEYVYNIETDNDPIAAAMGLEMGEDLILDIEVETEPADPSVGFGGGWSLGEATIKSPERIRGNDFDTDLLDDSVGEYLAEQAAEEEGGRRDYADDMRHDQGLF